jgi:hypothetical protein
MHLSFMIFRFCFARWKVNLTDGATKTLTGVSAAGDGYGYRDGSFLEARFRSPAALALSPDGTTAYVADTTNGLIRVLHLGDETVTTLCGCCGSSVTANNLGFLDGVGSSAQFNLPQARWRGLLGVRGGGGGGGGCILWRLLGVIEVNKNYRGRFSLPR